MKKCLTIITLILCMSTLSACGKDDKDDKGNQIIDNTDEYIAPAFDKDDNTISIGEEEVWKTKQQVKENEENNEEVDSPYDNVGEIQLINGNDNANFIVDNNDVIYNDIRYIDLYKNATLITMPYSINNFINFIINTYDTNETEVYTEYINYLTTNMENSNLESESEEVVDNVNISIDEQISNSSNYKQLKERYSSDATWTLDIYTYGGNNKGTIVGCEKYIAFINTQSNITIDMSKFNEAQEQETGAEETEAQEQETEEDTVINE